MQNSIHRANFLATIEDDLNEKTSDSIPLALAFTEVAFEWLGYDRQTANLTDGPKDRGVDFWFSSDAGFEFYQVKSHDLTLDGHLELRNFDKTGVDDLRRIVDLLIEESLPVGSDPNIQRLRREWDMHVAKRRMASEPQQVNVTLTLVLFGEGLTGPATEEYESFRATCTQRVVTGVPIGFRVHLKTIDDIIAARWRQDNREWRDKSGRKKDTVELHPECVGSELKWIAGHRTAVFYCRAIDLVAAFDDFGYQIFEPNVRAHIRESKVNKAIHDSLLHPQTRREFRFLNNGVTITCASYESPNANRAFFRVRQAGVVNGLQTVVAMHKAYGDLSHDEKADLERECYVLVRLLSEKAVSDINRVVLATNTQNPMQPRNLKSNTEEQVLYERVFAELGWFYERKQGAWDAFSNDPARWRTLRGCPKSRFLVATGSPGPGRRRERRVDNEEIAQTWLSFVGFSDEAVHRRNELFDDRLLYELAFLKRTKKHGWEHKFDVQAATEDAFTEAPSHHLMLASHFARVFARKLPRSARDARDEAIQRLGLDPHSAREVIDAKVAADHDFLHAQVLRGMSFLFVEFLGYILFAAFGPFVHDVGRRLLHTYRFKELLETGDYDSMVAAARSENVGADDLVLVAWFAFNHVIDELVAGTWRQNYLTAPTRTRFLYSGTDTRERIYKSFRELEGYMKRSQLTKAWAAHIPAGTTVSEYFRQTLQPSR